MSPAADVVLEPVHLVIGFRGGHHVNPAITFKNNNNNNNTRRDVM